MKEFDFIANLLKPIAGKNSLGLADDCAFFDGFAITKDILSAGTHFFPDDAPELIAKKALRVNLSDLAASGAEPFGFMIGAALPKGTKPEWLQKFVQGLLEDIKLYNFQMLGGDTVIHDAPLVISVTAIGKAPQPIIRAGAKLGDYIFVSGNIGDGFLGLRSKVALKTLPPQGGVGGGVIAETPPPNPSLMEGRYISYYELPTPRIDLITMLRERANSCIDISDGLLADLWHICEESGVGAEIFSDKIPVSDKSANLMDLITGGDDYQLCFTSSTLQIEGCYNIGRIIADKKLLLDGVATPPKGWEHSAKA